MQKKEINIVWFKRDLRLIDHEALFAAQQNNVPKKLCVVCHRPFFWRKKWEKVWEDVKYCSDKCRRNKNHEK